MANKYVAGTFSADGSSATVTINRGGVIKLGGSGGSNFGSGTITIQVQGADGLYYPSATTYTAADVVNIEMMEPTRVRLNLSGSTTPDLDYEIQSDSPVLTE
jgi:hypothetical protein